jgi:CHAT domain-containing protein
MRVLLLLFVMSVGGMSAWAQLGRSNRTYGRTMMRIMREGDTERAKEFINQLAQAGEARHRADIIVYSNLLMGDLMQRTGNYMEAERSFLKAYDVHHGSWKRSKKYLITSVSQRTRYDAIDQLAYFYLNTGNLKKAEQLFLESKKSRDSAFLKLSAHRIHPVIGLGSVYLRQGNREKALQTFEHARAMINRSTTTGFDFDNLNRLYYYDMIELCFSEGKLNEAQAYLENLSIAASGIGKFSSKLFNRLETARVFEMEARLYLLKKDYPKAQEQLDKANRYYPTKVTTSGVRMKIMKTQAMLYWQLKDWAKADVAFQDLVREYLSYIKRNFISMSEYEKEQFYSTLKNDFDLFNTYVVASFSRNPTILFEQMYDNVINTKALLLNGSNQKKNKILASGDMALIQKLRSWENAKARLSALYFQNESEIAIANLTAEIERLEKDLNKHSGLFEDVENPPTWQKVKATLKPGEAAIELIRTQVTDARDSSIYLMLVLNSTDEHPRGFIIPAGVRFEKRNLTYYRNAIMTKTEDKLSYKNFWQPLERNLSGINRIYLSPDGVYNQINLNALLNPTSGQYLIDEKELVNLTNSADLLSPEGPTTDSTAVLVGRPFFDDLAVNTTMPTEYGQRNLLSAELISFKEQEFIDLPGTEKELNVIEEALGQQGVAVTTFLGAEAAEQNVKSVKGPSVFHIATHGFFVEDSASLVSPMIRSGLVLAGVKSYNKSSEDGILTAYEATNLDLQNTSLAVLSACQTGLGEVRNGEGVYGLQRAIIVAGARNLLMSLWKVDDAATAELMAEFYKNRSMASNLVAFRQAEVALRKKYPEPYYWGAFIMLGR